MSQRTFTVQACWDEDAQVYYSESDIKGLHIEAKTLDEFEAVMRETAIDLIVRNHISLEELAQKPIRDLVPSILWQRPPPNIACA